jgi:hypothetical protein
MVLPSARRNSPARPSSSKRHRERRLGKIAAVNDGAVAGTALQHIAVAAADIEDPFAGRAVAAMDAVGEIVGLALHGLTQRVEGGKERRASRLGGDRFGAHGMALPVRAGLLGGDRRGAVQGAPLI